MPVSEMAVIREARAMEPYGFSLILDAPGIAATAVPGQFVHVDCGGDTLLRRPFGVCGVDGMRVRLCYELKGRGTELLTRVRAGELLPVMGPLGRGFNLTGERILLVGGSMGTAPLLFAASRSKYADAILGYRSADQELLSEDYKKVCGSVELCTDDGTMGEHAFPDALVRRRLQRESYDRVLICGPNAMMKAVAKVCKEAGAPYQVSLDVRMGCGVGACLVCACRDSAGHYRRVCKDGPVFDGEEMDWDD